MIDFKKLAQDYKEEALKTLSDLISYKSVLDEYRPNSDAPFGQGCKEALDYILNKGRKLGFVAKNVSNYAGHIEYGQGTEILGILAHLDVVPVNPSEWDTDPFKLTIKDGYMYARGTADDKGGLVASLYALKLLKDNHITLNKKVRLIMGCDEESGSRCLTHYFTKEEMPSLGFSPDAEFPVIYGEKAHVCYYLYLKDEENIIKSFDAGDRLNIVPAIAKMELNIDLKREYLAWLAKNNIKGKIDGDTYIAYGISSHAMCPQNGKNAATILLDFLFEYTNSKLANFTSNYLSYDPFGKKLNINVTDSDMGELTINPGTFKFKDHILEIGIDLRVPKNNYTKVINEALTKALNKYNFNYKKIDETPIHYVDKNSFLVKKLQESYQSITGDNINKPFTIGGGTYAKFIKNCVAFGPQRPNSPDCCHIANEYKKIDEFIEEIAIYAKAIYELGK